MAINKFYFIFFFYLEESLKLLYTFLLISRNVQKVFLQQKLRLILWLVFFSHSSLLFDFLHFHDVLRLQSSIHRKKPNQPMTSNTLVCCSSPFIKMNQWKFFSFGQSSKRGKWIVFCELFYRTTIEIRDLFGNSSEVSTKKFYSSTFFMVNYNAIFITFITTRDDNRLDA